MITSTYEGCWGQVIFCSCVEVSTHFKPIFAEARCKPWRGGADRVAQPPPWRFQSQTKHCSRLHDSDSGSRHATSRAVADTAHRADQINVQVSRACRQASVQSASLLSPRQPEPFLTCGLDTAEAATPAGSFVLRPTHTMRPQPGFGGSHVFG